MFKVWYHIFIVKQEPKQSKRKVGSDAQMKLWDEHLNLSLHHLTFRGKKKVKLFFVNILV